MAKAKVNKGTPASPVWEILDAKNGDTVDGIHFRVNEGTSKLEYSLNGTVWNLAQGVDTDDATAIAADLLLNKTAYALGVKITGTMPNKVGSATVIVPSTVDQAFPQGYYGGVAADGKVSGNANLVTANIKSGITIFGVAGKIEVVDTTEAVSPAAASNIESGKKAFVNGALVTGNIVNRGGAVVVTPGTTDQTKLSGIYTGNITISGDTDLVSSNIRAGADIFGVAGKTEVVDTTEATAPSVAGDILSGKVGFVNGVKITGTIASKGAQTYTPGTIDQTIAAGQYLSGIQTISGDADLVAANLKYNVDIFGIVGTYSAEVTNPITAATVLSGKIGFVNGAQITGTMPNRAGDVAAVSYHVSGTSLHIIPASGYVDGVDDATTITDADFISGNIRAGADIFGVAGATNVVDTTAGTAVAGDILATKIAFVDGAQITGTIASKGAQTYTPGTTNQTIAAGQYLSGIQTISGDADLITANIKAGANIFGVAGATNVVDTTAGTATAAQILSGSIAFVDGVQVTGTMPNNTTGDFATDSVTRVGTTLKLSIGTAGYFADACNVTHADANDIAANIKKDVTIRGLTGTYDRSGEDILWYNVGLAAPPFVGAAYDGSYGGYYAHCSIGRTSRHLFNTAQYSTAVTKEPLDGTTTTWSASVASTGEYTHWCSADSLGNVYVVCSGTSAEYAVAKVNSTGGIVWRKTSTQMGSRSVIQRNIAVGNDDCLYIQTTSDLIKVDTSGNISWNNTAYATTNVNKLLRHGTDGVLVLGSSSVIKITGSNTVAFTIALTCNDMAVDYATNDIYVISSSTIKKYNSSGVLQWTSPSVLGMYFSKIQVMDGMAIGHYYSGTSTTPGELLRAISRDGLAVLSLGVIGRTDADDFIDGPYMFDADYAGLYLPHRGNDFGLNKGYFKRYINL